MGSGAKVIIAKGYYQCLFELLVMQVVHNIAVDFYLYMIINLFHENVARFFLEKNACYAFF